LVLALPFSTCGRQIASHSDLPTPLFSFFLHR
jgi:hypothetical protein